MIYSIMNDKDQLCQMTITDPTNPKSSIDIVPIFMDKKSAMKILVSSDQDNMKICPVKMNINKDLQV